MPQDLLNIIIHKRRIRTCKCGFKFTTYERIESETQDFGKHSKQKRRIL